ncbi:MAG: hypothetical protein K1W25_03295 [Lachnospiraceae bacterium]|nr:MAG TPA: hypothetical protein [Caudoviricetes sp.]
MATKKVKVIEKNAGEKIAFEQSGTRLIFGDDEIMLNAAKYQKDWPVEVDICRDKADNLTIGTASGLRYVAQVMIPAATYTETVIEEPEAPEADAEGAEQTENGGMNQQNVQRDKNPLDMGDVTVVLWSIE